MPKPETKNNQDVTGMVTMELAPDEARLIAELRTFCYGRVIIYKDNGKCVRMEEKTVSKKL